jgi:uncharacterized cupredoxin-like copper-binding protein
MRRTALAAVGLAALALGATGCGSDDNDSSDTSAASTPASTPAASTPATSTPAAAGGASTVAIGETEYKLDPSSPTAKAGSVTFNVKNDGSIPHDLEVEGTGVEKKTETISPGSSSKLTVDLKPGKYEIYCTIDGHKDLGMKGEVTVS